MEDVLDEVVWQEYIHCLAMQDQQGRLQKGLELLESTENVQVIWGSSSTGTFSLDLLSSLQEAYRSPS